MSAASGVDADAIAECAKKYDERAEDGALYPAPYPVDDTHKDPGVRLVCVPVKGPDGGDALNQAAGQASAAFERALPEGFRVYQNPPHSFHVTVFHTGKAGAISTLA